MAGNAETELHSYFEKEVELLDQDEEAKTQDQELQARLDDWAKRFHFNVNMGATEIVATKKDAALNAEYSLAPLLHLLICVTSPDRA